MPGRMSTHLVIMHHIIPIQNKHVKNNMEWTYFHVDTFKFSYEEMTTQILRETASEVYMKLVKQAYYTILPRGMVWPHA